MTSQTSGVLARAALYSFFSALAAAIIYVIIALITGAISFVIALVFFSSFMLYFSRKKA